jgi:hypothetical protein
MEGIRSFETLVTTCKTHGFTTQMTTIDIFVSFLRLMNMVVADLRG